MIKAIIVDDEAYIRANLIESIAANFKNKIKVIAQAESVETAVNIIQEKQPDLLLLDVQLQDGTGFDILQKIDYKKLEIIFVTGYDAHAIKAIKVGALDYILKPIEEEEFIKALQMAINNSNQANDLEKLIEISSEHFRGVSKKRIVLKTLEDVHFVYEDDILHCQSEGNYTTFHTRDSQSILISKPLKKVIELLSKDQFIRCHQSHVVNKKHVARYNKQGYLILNSGNTVPVSGRLKNLVIDQIF